MIQYRKKNTTKMKNIRGLLKRQVPVNLLSLINHWLHLQYIMIWDAIFFLIIAPWKKTGALIDVNLGIYMKLWHFKEIKPFISILMKDEKVKKEDSWWKVNGIINKFIQKRKEVIIPCHMLVFDESMSAFVPR